MALNKKKILNELVEHLETNYLLAHACKKVRVSRRTVYRWMQNDTEFTRQIREAQHLGKMHLGDFVESKLIKNIEDRDQRAIEYWLKHHHKVYRDFYKSELRENYLLKEQLNQAQTALATIRASEIPGWVNSEERFMTYVDMLGLNENSVLADRILDGNFQAIVPIEQARINGVVAVLRQMIVSSILRHPSSPTPPNEDEEPIE